MKKIFTSFVFLFYVTAFSQINIVPDDGVVTDSTAVETVDVLTNIEKTYKFLKQVESKLRPSDKVVKIDSLLKDYTKFIAENKPYVEQFIKSNPNKQKIDNQISKWQGYDDLLNQWQKTVKQKTIEKETLLGEISLESSKWEKTLKNARKNKLPVEFTSNISSVHRSAIEVEEKLNKKINNLLRLETDIITQKGEIEQVLENLNHLENSEVYDLFYHRHPPLWKVSFTKEDFQGEEGNDLERFSKKYSTLITFFRNNKDQGYLYILMALSVIGLYVLLKKNYSKHPFKLEDGELQRAKDLIFSHTALSILFILVVIARLYFINRPALFDNALMFLALAFSVSIIKPNLYNRFKNLAYFIVLFYLIDTLKSYVWYTSDQYRVYLLFEILLIGGVLYKFSSPYKVLKAMKIGKFGKNLIKIVPFFYFLLIVSFLSNLLGYTNLTDLSIKIIVRSSVITQIYYGIFLVSSSVSTGLIHYVFKDREVINDVEELKVGRRALQGIRLLVAAYWFVYFLKMIDLHDIVMKDVDSLLSKVYTFGSLTITIGAVLNFLIILAISYVVTRVISFLLNSKLENLKFVKLPKGIPAAISLVVRYFILTFGVVLALSALGIDLSKFNLMAGALGLGIGFGLQTVISNFVSGLILVFERPILPGDTVEVNNLLGEVKRIGIRSSNIRTFDGSEVVVPNNNLISNDLINWTLSDNVKRIEVLIGVSYDADPNIVIELLKKIANDNEYSLKDPEPRALFDNFGDSSLNFRLLFWVDYGNGLQAKSDVSVAIYNVFKEHEINIPFPQRDIHIIESPSSNKQEDLS